MTCFRPLTAWQLEGGEIVWAERGKVRRELRLPCGRCYGCRLKRVRSWGIRCVHEASCHDVNSFVTLTYDNDHYSPSLEYRDVQLFLYRLRKAHGSGIRFFAAGEYGSINLRPHWHLLLFGFRPVDGVRVGERIFSSRELSRLWDNRGFVSFGDVTHESAVYCAKYCVKRVYSERAKSHYCRVDLRTGEYVSVKPECAHMSLRPHGLGYKWFEKYWKEVYLPRDGIVLPGGRLMAPPRYYDKLLEDLDFDLRDYKAFQRYVKAGEFAADCTPERLAVREYLAMCAERRKREVL